MLRFGVREAKEKALEEDMRKFNVREDDLRRRALPQKGKTTIRLFIHHLRMK